MSPVVPACSIPGSFPQKGSGLRGAHPRCSAAGCLRGSVLGARGEGKGPGPAQLIPASVGRKPGVGGSPGFPLGQRWARFISTPASVVHAGGQAAAVGKEAQRELGAARYGTARHGTAHLPRQGTDWLAMAPGASKTTWGSVEVALTSLCAILLCCGPMLAGCRRGRYRSAACSLARPMSFVASGKCLRAGSFVVKNSSGIKKAENPKLLGMRG